MGIDPIYRAVFTAKNTNEWQKKKLNQNQRKLLLLCCNALADLSKGQHQKIPERLKEQKKEIKKIIDVIWKNEINLKNQNSCCRILRSFFKAIANFLHLRVGNNQLEKALKKTFQENIPINKSSDVFNQMISKLNEMYLDYEEKRHALRIIELFYIISLKSSQLGYSDNEQMNRQIYEFTGLKKDNLLIEVIRKAPDLLIEKYEAAKKNNKLRDFFEGAFNPKDLNSFKLCYQRIENYKPNNQHNHHPRDGFLRFNNEFEQKKPPNVPLIKKPAVVNKPIISLKSIDDTLYDILENFRNIQLMKHAKALLQAPGYRLLTIDAIKNKILEGSINLKGSTKHLYSDFMNTYATVANFRKFFEENMYLRKACSDGSITLLLLERKIEEYIDAGLLQDIKEGDLIKEVSKWDALLEMLKEFQKIQLKEYANTYHFSLKNQNLDEIVRIDGFVNQFATTENFKKYLINHNLLGKIIGKKCTDGTFTQKDLEQLITEFVNYNMLGENVQEIPEPQPQPQPQKHNKISKKEKIPKNEVIEKKLQEHILEHKDEGDKKIQFSEKLEQKLSDAPVINEALYNEVLDDLSSFRYQLKNYKRCQESIDACYTLCVNQKEILEYLDKYYAENPNYRTYTFYPYTSYKEDGESPLHTEYPPPKDQRDKRPFTLAEVQGTVRNAAILFNAYKKSKQKGILKKFFEMLQNGEYCIDHRIMSIAEFITKHFNFFENVNIKDLISPPPVPLVNEKLTNQNNIKNIVEIFTEIQARKFYKDKHSKDIDLSWIKPENEDSHPRTQVIRDLEFQKNYNNKANFIKFLKEDVGIIDKETKDELHETDIDKLSDLVNGPIKEIKEYMNPQSDFNYQPMQRDHYQIHFEEIDKQLKKVKRQVKKRIEARLDIVKSKIESLAEKESINQEILLGFFIEYQALYYALFNYIVIDENWLSSQKVEILQDEKFKKGCNEKEFKIFLEKFKNLAKKEIPFNNDYLRLTEEYMNKDDLAYKPLKHNYTAEKYLADRVSEEKIKNEIRLRITKRRDVLNQKIDWDEKKTKNENIEVILGLFTELQALDYAWKENIIIDENWLTPGTGGKAEILKNENFRKSKCKINGKTWNYLNKANFRQFLRAKFLGRLTSDQFIFTEKSIEEYAELLEGGALEVGF